MKIWSIHEFPVWKPWRKSSLLNIKAGGKTINLNNLASLTCLVVLGHLERKGMESTARSVQQAIALLPEPSFMLWKSVAHAG